MMHVLFNNRYPQPLVSIVLLDWSVRESFHVLHYLNNQTVPREQYEIIWIEYYDRKPKEIETKLKECASLGKPPTLDKWIVMNMPEDIYYHKHLMYNVGIVASDGHIITFMDSDAVVKPTFVEAIARSFEGDKSIVLHMDQIRNMDKRHYPFNYPMIDKIAAEGGANVLIGKPKGLIDRSDPLHNVNYGSCMSALRDDLIAIGGADEHIDYLGHICGPYDMTFRLMNAGKKEIWHQTEWLYHTWHPGQAGDGNYAGPHDGRHMSTTALETRWTGRIMPLAENLAIRMLRLEQADGFKNESLLSLAIPEKEAKGWNVDNMEWKTRKYGRDIKLSERIGKAYMPEMDFLTKIYFLKNLFSRFMKHMVVFIRYIFIEDIKYAAALIRSKEIVSPGSQKGQGELPAPGNLKGKILRLASRKYLLSTFLTFYRNFFKIFFGIRYRVRFICDITRYNRFIADECWRNLYRLAKSNKDIAVFGVGSITKILLILTRDVPIKICGIYDDIPRKSFSGFDVQPIAFLRGYEGKIIVASIFGCDERVETLRRIGIKNENIIRLL